MRTGKHSVKKIRGFCFLLLILGILGIAVFRFTAETASAAGNRPEPRYKYYTSIQIAYGDSLWSIAEEYRTAEYADIYSYIEEVMEINHLSSDRLQAGDKLCIPYYSSEFKE